MSPILKKTLFMTLCGLSLIGLANHFWQIRHRQPASTRLHSKVWADSLSGKMNQAITVTIKSIGGIPDHDGQDLHLRAEVTLNRSIESELQFQWILPPGTAVVSGGLEDAWVGLKPGQTAVTELTVNNVSREGPSKTIFLHAISENAGIKIGGVGAFGVNDSFLDSSSEAASDSIGAQNKKTDTPSEPNMKKEQLLQKLNQNHQ